MKHMETESPKKFTWLMPAITLLPLAAGLSLWTNAAFPSLNLYAAGYAAALYALSLLCARIYRFRYGIALLPAGFAALLGCVIFWRKSFLILFNDFFTSLQRVTGHINLPAADTGNARTAVQACLLVGAALLLGRAVFRKSPLWLTPVLIPLLEGAFSGVAPVGWGAGLIGVGILLLLRQNTVSRRALAARCAVVAVCALLAFGAGYAIRNVPQDGVRTAIVHLYHRIRYTHRADTLPEGRLDHLKPAVFDGTPALKITMEKPCEMYLRGNIFEYYTGSAWTHVPAAERADFGELFSWLHDTGFFGQSQIGTVSALCGEKASKTTVENLSACGAHGYLPYGVQNDAFMDATLIGDMHIPRVQTTFLRYTDDLHTLYSLPQKLKLQQSDAAEKYDTAEQAFRQYVRQKDLAMPSETHDALYPLLGVPKKGQTLSQIETAVRDVLQKALTYDTSVGVPTGKGDFLERTIQSGRGWNVHYATAAVLMLRYYGVPARYVEGFYLPEKEAQKECYLTKAHAHAWAELYLDGVGFVPFEVTPGYWNEESPEPDGDRKAAQKPVQPQMQPVPSPTPIQNVEDVAPHPTNLNLLWLLALIPAAILAYILAGRIRLRKALSRIAESEQRAAVRMLYAYSQKLSAICPRKLSDAPKACKLYLEARYSDHPLTDQQRRKMEHYVHTMQHVCQQELPLVKRLYWKYIRFYF